MVVFTPITDGSSGVESALILSQSKAEHVSHSHSYGFRVPTRLLRQRRCAMYPENSFVMGIYPSVTGIGAGGSATFIPRVVWQKQKNAAADIGCQFVNSEELYATKKIAPPNIQGPMGPPSSRSGNFAGEDPVARLNLRS